MANQITQIIREELNKRKLTVTALANETGLKRPLVSSIVNGLRKAPLKDVKLVLFTLGFSKKRTDELASQYEDYYEVARNNRDFKFYALMDKYQLNFPFINPENSLLEDKDGSNALAVFRMDYKSEKYSIGVVVKGYRGATKNDVKAFRFQSGEQTGLEIEGLDELLSFLSIESRTLLELFRFMLVKRTRDEKFNRVTGAITIDQNWIAQASDLFINFWANKNAKKIVASSKDLNRDEAITFAYKQCAEDMKQQLEKFLETELDSAKKTEKIYPVVFKVLEEKFSQLP